MNHDIPAPKVFACSILATPASAKDVLFVNSDGTLGQGVAGLNGVKLSDPNRFQSNCKSCAAPLKQEKHACEYCGTEYRIKPAPIKQLALSNIPPLGPPSNNNRVIAISAPGLSLFGPLHFLYLNLMRRRR